MNEDPKSIFYEPQSLIRKETADDDRSKDILNSFKLSQRKRVETAGDIKFENDIVIINQSGVLTGEDFPEQEVDKIFQDYMQTV